MYYLELALRWAHILGAILLVGGVFYQRVVLGGQLQPASDREADQDVRDVLRRRWSIVVMIATTLLLISGLANTAIISIRYRFPEGYYNILLGIKLLLAFVMFYLAAVLAGRSSTSVRLRQDARKWLNVLIVLSLLIIGIASAMKAAVRETKERTGEEVSMRG
jgi:hypothetical protein